MQINTTIKTISVLAAILGFGSSMTWLGYAYRQFESYVDQLSALNTRQDHLEERVYQLERVQKNNVEMHQLIQNKLNEQ